MTAPGDSDRTRTLACSHGDHGLCAGETISSEPVVPCECECHDDPSSADRQTLRGSLFGDRCAVCGSEFTDEDRPTYTGPMARIAATGLTMTCRVCREYAEVCRANGQKPDVSRLWGVVKFEALSAWRIPNIVRRLGRRAR